MAIKKNKKVEQKPAEVTKPVIEVKPETVEQKTVETGVVEPMVVIEPDVHSHSDEMSNDSFIEKKPKLPKKAKHIVPEGSKKYQFTYRTDNDKKISLQFGNGVSFMVSFGSFLYLTKEQYKKHENWLVEMK